MLNHIDLVGRLVHDPELRQTNTNTAVTTLSVAVTRTHNQKETDFFDVVAWGTTAENVCRYLTKGSQVAVEGCLQQRKWKDKDGNPRSTVEINAQNVFFLSSPKRGKDPEPQHEPEEYPE